METICILCAVVLVGLIMTGIFVLGALFAIRVIANAEDDAHYDRLCEKYYQLAGVKTADDPRPYVPPRAVLLSSRRTPRNGILPGMSALDRLMKEGKRGTLMWSAKDRENKGGN